MVPAHPCALWLVQDRGKQAGKGGQLPLGASLYFPLPRRIALANRFFSLFSLSRFALGTDTIDLQDRDAPSAKDHSHVKTSTNTKYALSSSTPSDNILQLASHQAETLRGVAAETAQDRRISWTGSNLSDLHIYGSDLAADIADTLNLSRSLQEPAIETGAPSHVNMTDHQQQDALAVAQNGGLAADVVEEDMEDVDDEELEDDMMDKISSSPSIEDGAYTQSSGSPPISSVRAAVNPNACAASRSSSIAKDPTRAGGSPPAPCHGDLARPPHSPKTQPLAPVSENTIPLRVSGNDQACKAPFVSPDGSAFRQHRRHRGRYNVTGSSEITETIENTDPETVDHDEYDVGPLFDAPSVTAMSATKVGIKEHSFSIVSERWDVAEDLFDEMMIPYYDDDDDGDDDANGGADAFYIHDSDLKFVISGWGSECLHNIEDIDFEFVYALHTFMATVEGQANATKGDTMVLLDDSNSYWWLVRVVKDSSIGELYPVFLSVLLCICICDSEPHHMHCTSLTS